MRIAEELFNDLTPVLSRLIEYGFIAYTASDGADTSSGEGPPHAAPYKAVYSTLIMNGAFELTVTVNLQNTLNASPASGGRTEPHAAASRTEPHAAVVHTDFPEAGVPTDPPASLVTASLIDTGTGDEYTPVDNIAYIGAYVGTVRQEAQAVLEDIAARCFYRKGNAWIIPSKPAMYDIWQGFNESPDHTLLWTQRMKVSPGDLLFIYHTEPIASLACRCEIVETDIPTDDGDGFTNGKKLMRIKLIERYTPGLYPRSFLNAHGIKKTVRGQRSAPPELVIAVLGL